jgi:perosamine synthetase
MLGGGKEEKTSGMKIIVSPFIWFIFLQVAGLLLLLRWVTVERGRSLIRLLLVLIFLLAINAVAVDSGTAALHIALLLAGVGSDDEVITQPLTFVATANAISYCKAHPVFVDVDRTTLGLDPEQLAEFLQQYGNLKADGCCYNLATGRRISACVPMHTFGHPCRIDQVVDICRKYCIPVVEDAAEALGSFYCGRHVGLFGDIGILSFNGNKPVTTGGGGMIITDNEDIAKKAKHLTTTAKQPHPWEFNHDCVGYNYRMPNINAAVGCAQMESFSHVLENKRQTARMYHDFFQKLDISFVSEPENAQSNYFGQRTKGRLPDGSHRIG